MGRTCEIGKRERILVDPFASHSQIWDPFNLVYAIRTNSFYLQKPLFKIQSHLNWIRSLKCYCYLRFLVTDCSFFNFPFSVHCFSSLMFISASILFFHHHCMNRFRCEGAIFLLCYSLTIIFVNSYIILVKPVLLLFKKLFDLYI